MGKSIDLGASDLHFKTGSPPWVRVDGEISPYGAEVITADEMIELVRTIIPKRLLESFENFDEVDFAYTIQGICRFRINVYRQRETISAAIRALPYRPIMLSSLNLPPAIEKLAMEPRGLIIVTGVTGSGKSTTLAAMIEQINTNLKRHIITIEDPIELLYRDKNSIIDQREIGIDTESYPTALKFILRQDPDVILIGEMRDLETVKAALTAAETGHLVLSTLHTLDAAETVNRIIDLFPSGQQMQVRYQLAATLKGIISQRLLVKKDGQGRVPAVEVMVMTGRIHDFIIEPKDTQNIPQAIQEGEFYGMQTFDQSLTKLVLSALISYETACDVATQPHDFKLNLQQMGYSIPKDDKESNSVVIQ